MLYCITLYVCKWYTAYWKMVPVDSEWNYIKSATYLYNPFDPHEQLHKILDIHHFCLTDALNLHVSLGMYRVWNGRVEWSQGKMALKVMIATMWEFAVHEAYLLCVVNDCVLVCRHTPANSIVYICCLLRQHWWSTSQQVEIFLQDLKSVNLTLGLVWKSCHKDFKIELYMGFGEEILLLRLKICESLKCMFKLRPSYEVFTILTFICIT